ncbi:hypothetical protein [Hymenobacter algoricola]|uniref:hypothetical protein n=1 Tax=Hymenobacter algoricola TaxID=486267 RepID=UPI0031EFFEAE
MWQEVDEAYFLLDDLSKLILSYIHQEALRSRLFSFIDAQYAQADYTSCFYFAMYVFEDWLPNDPHRYFKFSLQQLMIENLTKKALQGFIDLAKELGF